jgi:alpha-soluble NSF attachment protein
MAKKESKGTEFLNQGEKKLKSFSLFGGGQKYDDAIELFQKAAAQFKIQTEWEEAAKAFIRAAEVCEKFTKDNHGASSNYTEAAKCYKHCSPKDAVKTFELAIHLNLEDNRFAPAAKLWKEVADLEEKEMNTPGAIKAHGEAAKLFEAEDNQTSALQCHLAIAKLSAEEGDYKTAISLWEKAAKQQADTSLGKYSVKDYLFKAALCHMAVGAAAGDISGAQTALQKYTDTYATFDGTREAKLLEALTKAYEEEDVDKFTEAIFKYDQVSKLDGWTTKILLVAKNALKEGGNSNAAPTDDNPLLGT